MMKLAEKVYYYCKKVPRGKVTTYGEIARVIGTKGYRAVGGALNRNPHAPVVPCHRVVNSKGELHGFAWGINKKELMLKKEGITITKGKVDLKKYGYKFG
ncbi:MAG: MGMT family protein [Nanoarchaeota archaeon]